MQKKYEDLKNEEAKVEAKLKMYLQKLTHLENTVSLQQKGAAINSAVNVSLIQKMVVHLEAKDDDIVQLNSNSSGADGDLEEKQLSPPAPPLGNSAANRNGCAAGSGNTDFTSTKINLLDYPDVHTLHPIPCAGGFAHVNSNVSNIQKKRRQSQQATAGSGDMDFTSTKMNLLDYPDVQTLHPIPSAGGSAHVNSNVSNIQKKRRQSQQAGSGNMNFISTEMNLPDYPDVQTLHPIPSAGGSANVNSNVSNIQNKRRHSQQAATSANYCNNDIVHTASMNWHLIANVDAEVPILQEECQIRAVMYTEEIEQYAAMLKLLNTYLISTAKVKVSPTSYGKPIHKFQWILDKETVIEHIQASDEVEKPLPPPTKLNITGFDRIPHLMVDSTAEIDIQAIVLRCGPQKNAGRSHHRCREITLCDNQKNQFLFTLWEDFGEIEGHEISSKMATEADLLVILGRSIGISTYQGLSLQTRYNSTVRVNPNYPQAVALIKWAKENKTMLLGSPSEKTLASSSISPMIVTPAGQQLISIAEISTAPSMGMFYVEAEMAILDEFQDFCVLECSGCKQKKRTKDKKDFQCPKCNQKTSLVPRCSFQIDLIDNTATTTASISAELGEKLLSMTAEDIFDITCTKRQSLSLTHVHEMLSSKLFEIQLRKSSWGSSNTTNATLSILSYMEKQHTPKSTTDRTPKKIKPLETSEVEVMATIATAGPSNATGKFEPPTPTKKV
ncbi:hypothetical protein KY285_004246 [Solanum tuberosum]|nr:hypothetical protein KY284_004448 [Solanum tuberosum]KAH0768375.1 hypothetical protein KY285_004246 [Solanum tuberosum]